MFFVKVVSVANGLHTTVPDLASNVFHVLCSQYILGVAFPISKVGRLVTAPGLKVQV